MCIDGIKHTEHGNATIAVRIFHLLKIGVAALKCRETFYDEFSCFIYLAYSAPFGGQGMYEYLKACFEVLIHALHIARAMINIITDLSAKGNEP